MTKEGKYIYGIIGTNEVRNFGPIGVGGQGNTVSTICYQNISAVISDFITDKYEISKENLIAHQKVVEKVMDDHTILPVRAFTVAANAEEVRDFLRKRYLELTGLLKDMDNKIELSLIASWRDIASIFQEIANANMEIKQLKEEMATAPEQPTLKQKIALGRKVANALKIKKEGEGEEITHSLSKIALDVFQNDVHGDKMIFNTAFLIDRGWENEFDSKVDELDRKYTDRIRFKYVGPGPPYNFVNLRI